MSGWYAVNTFPHQDARADLNLRRQGYRSWLPAVSWTWRHARKIDTMRAPLFPGCLFVELDLDRDAWSPINGTFGVRKKLLCHRDRPVPMPAGFVDARVTAGGGRRVGVGSLGLAWVK